MKKYVFAILLLGLGTYPLYGQLGGTPLGVSTLGVSTLGGIPLGGTPPETGHVQQDLPIVYVNEQVSTHFVFPEPIQKVDISTERVAGDLLLENLLRIKPKPGSGDSTSYLGVLTIVGQQFMVQYHLRYTDAAKADKNKTVSSQDGISLISPEVQLSEPEMKRFCVHVLAQKRSIHGVKSKKNRLEIRLNNIFTVGNYFFVDISVRNKTHIAYSIDEWRFKVEDKKISRATNAQAVEIKPVYALYDVKSFRRQYRNVFVFEKFTFPSEKIFSITLAEKQISGRQIVLQLAYRNMLNADPL